MYINFNLKETEYGEICGYHWPLENPDAVVCIIHGIGEYAGRYERVARRLLENNLAVIAMDLRGHGRTDGPVGHCAPRSQVLGDIDDLLKYAQATYPDKDIVLYGHSMGGNITLDYRCIGNLRAVPAAYLITSPWVSLVRPITGIQHKIVSLICRIKPEFAIGSKVDESVLGNLESVRPYNDDEYVHSKISAKCALDGFEIGCMLQEGRLSADETVSAIPTLIMIGSEDRICDPQGSRDMFQGMEERGENAQLIEWEGLYHEIHNGGGESKGDEVIDKIVEFALSRSLTEK